MDRYKKTAYIFGRRSDSRYGIFRLCSGNGLCQQTVSAARCAGIDAQASQGVQPLVRNKVTQKTARTFGCPGCLPRRAHILPSGEYRSAPFAPKGYFLLSRNSDVQCVLIYSDTNISHFLSLLGIIFNGFCFINLIPHFFDYLMCPYYPALYDGLLSNCYRW